MFDRDSENVVKKSITVGRDVQAAFFVWTQQINRWWPAGHSVSGDPKTQVFIEGKVGGRFYERASDGVEHEWGRVTVWDPPHRFALNWYLGSSRELPTKVEINFVALNQNQTRIEVEHYGPTLIGELWWLNKSKYSTAWDRVLSEYAAGCSSMI